jgi:CNT family concentrative nucleoside transporter
MVLTCGMSTVASTTLAIYVLFLRDTFPHIAGHLISASFLSIPAAALVSKLMLPETERPATLGGVPPVDEGIRQGNLMAALAAGAWDGLRLAAGIATLLIAVLGVVGVLDWALAALTSPLDESLGGPLRFERVLSWIFAPLAWLLGIEGADVTEAGTLLGSRFVMTEVVAYQKLAALAASGAVSARTVLILSYALCGFAHVASRGSSSAASRRSPRAGATTSPDSARARSWQPRWRR